MKIESVRIRNFRLFKDETIPFNDYTAFIGPNGCGKSTVFCALNIFFQHSEGSSTPVTQLYEEDFHHKNTKEPVVITVTFSDLSAEAQADFAAYVRHGKLSVSAVATYDEATGKAPVKQCGERLVIPEFSDFFSAEGDGAKVDELQKRYAAIREIYDALPDAKTKPAMMKALQEYEGSHPEQAKLLQSNDQFYGVTKGKNILEKYVQWVYVPAVKDATTEQVEAKNTALGKLLARTVRQKTKFDEGVKELRTQLQEQYQGLLDAQQGALDEISLSLGKKLSLWAHPDASLKVEWKQDPEKSVKIDEPFAQIIAGEGSFKGELVRFGHGFQRTFLFVILQELAASEDDGGPMLILGCEEPELFQHPPQARHLANVLNKLSQGNSQVMTCTHSPYFITGQGFEDVRLFCKGDTQTSISWLTYADFEERVSQAKGEKPKKPVAAVAKLHQSLQPSLNEMFFAPCLILVEGLEDVAYISTYMELMGLSDEYRLYGCHMVPVNGKSNIIHPLAIAQLLNIPTFTLIDGDGDNSSQVETHKKENLAVLKLSGVDSPEAFPKNTLWKENLIVWPTNIGDVVRKEIPDWQKFSQKAESEHGQAGNLGKNSLFIATCLSVAWDAGQQSASLKRLCESILKFGKSQKLENSDKAASASC